MLTFAARPKSSVFGSHSTNIDNSSSIMGQGGGGTSRLKRLSWMLHPSRQAQSLGPDASPLSPRSSSKKSARPPTKAPTQQPTQEPTQEPTSKAPKDDVKLVPSSIPQEDPIQSPSIAMPNATPDMHKSMADQSTTVSAEVDADSSTTMDAVPDTKSHLPTTVHVSTAASVATSASTSDSSSNASEDASPTEARKSSISFPTDLPKPEHSPSIQTPVDALSESSFGRKSSVSSVSFRRPRNHSVANSLHKPASNGQRIRPASPPPQR
ncbi:hypothetical protein E4U43_004846 [Claviceps pusilla]|uniref:Uncharacterized protein n=1 Tax=Claviceps pusilla TaxID=123648 RepID=A0A9P7SUF6_9HYPO|nr:hypothetical protein E4U43_004846 [Claviceps pusilla]